MWNRSDSSRYCWNGKGKIATRRDFVWFGRFFQNFGGYNSDKNIECVVSVGNVCVWYSDYLGDDSVGDFASVKGFEAGEACEI